MKKKRTKDKKILGMIKIPWSWMIILWYPRKKLPRAAKLAQQSHFTSLSLKNSPSRTWSHRILNQKRPWLKVKKNKIKMITSEKRPNLVTRKDRVTKQLLLRKSCSLLPLIEAWKKTSNAMRHPKPHPNKSSFHQWNREKPKQMRKDPSERNRSEQRRSRLHFSTNFPRFAFLETPKRGRNASLSKHKITMRSVAQPWLRKRSNSKGSSKKNDPIETWQSALTDQSPQPSL